MKSLNSDELDEIDRLIKTGQQNVARAALTKIQPAHVSRAQYAQFVNLLCRTGLVSKGLRLLNPLVRDPRMKDGATPQEKMEYAYLLVKIGALQEARKILDEIDVKEYPLSLLYYTFSLTPEWRYEATIPLLEKFIAAIGTSMPYSSLIAQVNLAAAQVFTRDYDQARSVLYQAKLQARKQGAQFLLGSLLELSAQLAVGESRWSDARGALEEAASLLRFSVTVESLYVRKWQTVLAFLTSPQPEQMRATMTSFRGRAFREKQWEVARDLDFQFLRRIEDQELFSYLYCGSPAPAFRLRLEKSFPLLALPSGFYGWTGRPGPHTPPTYDLTTGKTDQGECFLERGQAPHRLLLILARDFYRPTDLAQIASFLYPDDHYHPRHTPIKVHQIVSRLRKQIDQTRIPISIESLNGALRLCFKGNCTLVKDWRIENVPLMKTKLELDPILTELRDRFFSARDLARLMDASLSCAVRRIRHLVESGLVQRHGTGKNTRYILVTDKTPFKTAA